VKGECDNCGYFTEVEKYRKPDFRDEGRNSFCLICASTLLSTATTYPRQVIDVKLYQSIGWIANHLADLIRERNPEIQGRAGASRPLTENEQ
jgi:hypothetical protein